jgi:hypothetical protein
LTAFFIKRITWGPNDDKIKDLEAQLTKANREGNAELAKQLAAQVGALRAELLVMHETLVADLAKVLTPEQIDTMKEALTFGRGRLVYNDVITKHVLTDVQKAAIAKLLNAGRDVAWMAGSADDKHAIMGKAVGRVNNYLDALKKVEAIKEAIRAGNLKDAQETLAKLEQRDWLKELLAQELAELHKSLEAAMSGRPAASAPVTTRPAGN